MLQEAELDSAVDLGHADALAEIADGRRCIAAAAQSRQGRHARVVPAGDVSLLDQAAQLALAHDSVIYAEPGKFNLPGLRLKAAVGDDPIVKRAVILKLKRTEAVCDALDGVFYRMRKVVHRVDAPLVALAVMVAVVDAVDDGVAHIEVAGGGVDLGAQRHGAVRELAGAHAPEEVEALLQRPVAVGAARGRVDVAAHLAHLVGAELADIGETFLDEIDGALVHDLEIIGGIEKPVTPVETEPVYILFYRLDIFDIFL